jgi:hypothetical protein
MSSQNQNKKAQNKMLPCCDCHGSFSFPEKEAAFFAAQGFPEPMRCIPCRAAKKAKHLQPSHISCTKCETKFIFTVNAQKHFKEQGWAAPIRCFECRKQKKADHEKAAAEKPESKEEYDAVVAVVAAAMEQVLVAEAPAPLPALPPSPPSE